MHKSDVTHDQNEVTERLAPVSTIWNPAFNEFRLGDSPQVVSANLPRRILPDWINLPQAFEYRHDLVKYFWLELREFGDEISKFIPPDVSVNEASYICFLFFNQKLFHISIRFFRDEKHQNYDKIVEAYARTVNTPIIESENGKEFYYDDKRIIYFSCYHPERGYTCMDVIQINQTTSTDGHWFNLPRFHDQVPKTFIQPVKSPQPYKYDIMISYCHKDKELVYDIYEHLIRSKFNVWIDLENIYGPIVARMAEAIENSQFVLLCMSDAYKSSAYCQLEAEYAFKFQSILIPLVIKNDFKQTGWLGMLCGLRLHIDFTITNFEVAYGKLLSELLRHRAQTDKKIQWPTHEQQQQQVSERQTEDSTNISNEQKSKKNNESDDQQRLQLVWELNHKEANEQKDIISGYIFSINNEECQNGLFSFEYDSVIDQYYRNGIKQEKTLGWIDQVYSCSNVQREVERDSHMVYLCRRKQGENFSTGSISWLIELDKKCQSKYRFDRITLRYSSTSFNQFACVQWQLSIGKNKTIDLPENSNKSNISFEYRMGEEESCVEHLQLCLIATLTNLNDDYDNRASKQPQLFRQSIDHSSYDEQPHRLQINVTIIDRQSFYF